MSTKTKNIFKILALLLLTSLIFINCQEKEDEILPILLDELNFRTVSFEEAKQIFLNAKNTKKQSNFQKRTSDKELIVTPQWETITQNELEYTDGLMTEVETLINRKGNYSTKAIFIEVNGIMVSVLETYYADSIYADGTIENGMVYYNDFDGSFIDAYKVQSGTPTKRYILSPLLQKAGFFMPMLFQNFNDPNCWNTDNLPEDNQLDEVVVVAPAQGHNNNSVQIIFIDNYIIPTSGNDGQIGTGGAGNNGAHHTLINCINSTSGISMLSTEQKEVLTNFIDVNGCNQESKELVKEAIEIMIELPNAKFERILELNELLEGNPWALIQDCAEQNGLSTTNYLDLYDQTIPKECSDRLFNLGVEWHHQPITDGNVPLANIDYYGVEVTNHPDFNNDGNSDSESQIYQAFREKFIDVASGELQDFQFSCDINFDGVVNSGDTGNTDWEFVPLTTQDGTDFISNNPIASILLIEATASGLGSIAADDGAVIVSDFTDNNWTISTIMTANNGTQPFSGNRQWGWLINQNGNFEFFTRAVDVANISKLLNFLPGGANTECQQDTYYNIAEATWENMQQEIVDWINSPESNGGQASIVPKTAIRIDREKIEELLTSNETINEINCD